MDMIGVLPNKIDFHADKSSTTRSPGLPLLRFKDHLRNLFADEAMPRSGTCRHAASGLCGQYLADARAKFVPSPAPLRARNRSCRTRTPAREDRGRAAPSAGLSIRYGGCRSNQSRRSEERRVGEE